MQTAQPRLARRPGRTLGRLLRGIPGLAGAGLALALSLTVVSCNNPRIERPDDEVSTDPNGGDPLRSTLTITPADHAITVDGKTSARIPYRVFRQGEDVTDRATLLVLDDRVGYFEGATFVGRPTGVGKTRIRAQLGEEVGETTLRLRLGGVVIAPGTPADAPTKFGGPDWAKRAPEIAYPPPSALVPPNINELEFHFQPKESTLFELHFVGDGLDLRVYTTCQAITGGLGGCAYLPDESTWKLLSEAGRGQSIELTMRGTVPDGGGVGTSAAQTLSFSENDMKGGLYYWAASVGGVARYDFGLRGQRAESFYDPFRAVAVCVGCHALSRNGKRIAVGMNIPGPATMRALETSSRNKLFEVGDGIPLNGGSNYQAFTADGSWLITTEKGGLTLRNGTTGTIVGNNPALEDANMPDVSPDGKLVVFSRNVTPQCVLGFCVNLSVQGATLYTVPFKGMDGFGMPTVLAPANGANNYYPSISPDNQWVVYNRANGDSYDAADARVMIVKASGGQPIELSSVNTTVGNSWPKWGPFQHRFQGKSIMWVTFSSRRAYGLRPTPAAQIWMAPVQTDKLEAGKDSGFPAIRLPFQDLGTGNHIAQWVETVDRQPCSEIEMKGCGPDEQCIGGYCRPVIK